MSGHETVRSGDGSPMGLYHDMTAVVERAALEKLFDVTGGKRLLAVRNWKNRSGWRTDEPLEQWFGVTLNEKNRVYRLELGENGCRGHLPRELEDLLALTVLNLYRNFLSGPIPPELGALSALTKLELSCNSLSGHIPPSLGKLSALVILGLSYNDLTGSIPDELGDLLVLQVLCLERNNLTGVIPASLLKLKNLRIFRWKQQREYSLSGGPEKGESLAEWRSKFSRRHQIYGEVNARQDQPTDGKGPFSERFGTGVEESSHITQENDLRFRGDERDEDVFTALGVSDSPAQLPTYEESFDNTTERQSGLETTIEDDNETRKQVPSHHSNLEVFEDVQKWSKSGQSTEIKGVLRLEDSPSTPRPFPPRDTSDLFTGRMMYVSCLPDCGKGASTETGKNINDFALDLDDKGDNLAATELEFEERAHKNRRHLEDVALGSIGFRAKKVRRNNHKNGYKKDGWPPFIHPAEDTSKHGKKKEGREEQNAAQRSSLWREHSAVPFWQKPRAWTVAERAALEKLFDATGGKKRPAPRNWGNRSGWKTNEPLERWFGVTLNGENRVCRLELGDNGCRGHLPRELGDLLALTVLNLYSNFLSGPIPPELGTLSALTRLELSFNSLSGDVPPSLGKLSALVVLDLSYNKLSGSIPDELGDLLVLQILRLERNNLTGVIPATFLKLTNLRLFRWKQHQERSLSGGPEKGESLAEWRAKLPKQHLSPGEVDARQDQPIDEESPRQFSGEMVAGSGAGWRREDTGASFGVPDSSPHHPSYGGKFGDTSQRLSSLGAAIDREENRRKQKPLLPWLYASALALGTRRDSMEPEAEETYTEYEGEDDGGREDSDEHGYSLEGEAGKEKDTESGGMLVRPMIFVRDRESGMLMSSSDDLPIQPLTGLYVDSLMPRKAPRPRKGIHPPIGVEEIETIRSVDIHHQSPWPRQRDQGPTFGSSGDVSQQSSGMRLNVEDLPFQETGIRKQQEPRISEWEKGWDFVDVSPDHLGGQTSHRVPKWEPRVTNLRETEATTMGKHATKQLTGIQGVSMPLDEPPDENRVRRKEIRRSWGPNAVAADPVVFSCFAPPAVSGGKAFLLRIFAYLRQQRDDVLDEAHSAGVIEAGVPGAVRILRNKRVTIKLDLPMDKFQILPDDQMVIGGAPIQAPSVRDFVWTGDKANADFKIGCKQDAEPGVVHCNAMVIEGDTTTRLSFRIRVVQAGLITGIDREELETSMEEVLGEVAAISPDELEIEGLLGRGVQGETFAGIWRGKPVAIKRLAEYVENSNPERSFSTLEHEAAILSRLGHHPHIVEFYGLCRRSEGSDCSTVEVVTKLEKGGSLEQALGLVENGRHHETCVHHGGRFNTSLEFGGGVRMAWARDIACGLANSHAAGVVHNDVACRNALLSERGVGGRALLCDFGISDVLRGAELEAARLMDQDARWPLRQLPKEAWEEPHALSAASDSWMFGTMLYELFTGRKPFADLETKEVRRLVLEGKRLETPELLKNQGAKMVEVYEGCLSSDWWSRLSMEDIVVKLTPTTL